MLYFGERLLMTAWEESEIKRSTNIRALLPTQMKLQSNMNTAGFHLRSRTHQNIRNLSLGKGFQRWQNPILSLLTSFFTEMFRLMNRCQVNNKCKHFLLVSNDWTSYSDYIYYNFNWNGISSTPVDDMAPQNIDDCGKFDF